MADCEVRLSGSGGQGLLLSAGMLAEALVREGRAVTQSQSYEPTSRGGLSRSDLIVSDEPADFPLVTALDWLVILDQCAVEASAGLIRDGATVIVDTDAVNAPPAGDIRLIALPLIDTANRLGNKRVANIVALGALVAVSGLCDPGRLAEVVKKRVPPHLVDLNLEALKRGQTLAASADAQAATAEASLTH